MEEEEEVVVEVRFTGVNREGRGLEVVVETVVEVAGLVAGRESSPGNLEGLASLASIPRRGWLGMEEMRVVVVEVRFTAVNREGRGLEEVVVESVVEIVGLGAGLVACKESSPVNLEGWAILASVPRRGWPGMVVATVMFPRMNREGVPRAPVPQHARVALKVLVVKLCGDVMVRDDINQERTAILLAMVIWVDEYGG